jgi:NAD(P)H-hydrate repair Nnr-like enzyme with NAD(P)H-hydrate dehydratase domain
MYRAVIVNHMNNVIAPHKPTDMKKVEALRSADRSTVPPVVGLSLGDGEVFALNGSHRIVAGFDVAMVADGNAVYEAADETQREALDALFAGHGGDFERLCGLILPLLPTDMATVLAAEYGLVEPK